jgi:hypothetical protein
MDNTKTVRLKVDVTISVPSRATLVGIVLLLVKIGRMFI